MTLHWLSNLKRFAEINRDSKGFARHGTVPALIWHASKLIPVIAEGESEDAARINQIRMFRLRGICTRNLCHSPPGIKVKN